jgi:hypothetical protein
MGWGLRESYRNLIDLTAVFAKSDNRCNWKGQLHSYGFMYPHNNYFQFLCFNSYFLQTLDNQKVNTHHLERKSIFRANSFKNHVEPEVSGFYCETQSSSYLLQRLPILRTTETFQISESGKTRLEVFPLLRWSNYKTLPCSPLTEPLSP